jgi:hypothetical protein
LNTERYPGEATVHSELAMKFTNECRVPHTAMVTKHLATALFLLRTEVLGLNAWLASIQVPDILPRCPCGWQAQTVRHIHVLLHCPNYASERPRLIAQTRTENLREMLSKPERAMAAAKWFVRQGVLEQFNTAREIEAEDAAQYVPFQELDSWM